MPAPQTSTTREQHWGVRILTEAFEFTLRDGREGSVVHVAVTYIACMY